MSILVAILDTSSSLMGRGAKRPAGIIILVILMMELGHGCLNIFFAIDKYNQLLKPKWNLP